MEDKIFGIDKAEVQRQIRLKEVDVDPESKFDPMKKGESIEATINGGKEILSDPQTRTMLRRIYRSR